MDVTLESLARRVEELERDVAEWRRQNDVEHPDDTPLQRTARRLGLISGNRGELIALAKEAGRKMGLPETPPVSVEELHALFLKDGIRPEDNVISSGIIEARNAARGPEPKE